jgi:hypothetical protein
MINQKERFGILRSEFRQKGDSAKRDRNEYLKKDGRMRAYICGTYNCYIY